jgi:ligand-binding sensor domain-containing protein
MGSGSRYIKMTWISQRARKRRMRVTAVMVFSMIVGLLLISQLYRKKERLFQPRGYVQGMARYFKEAGVYDITVDEFDSSRVWFGTDAGIRIYNRTTDDWHYLGLENGLLNETVAAITPAESRIWVGTWQGLQAWVRDDRKLTSGVEGLTSPHIFSLCRLGDSLWVTTDDGVNVLKSDSVIKKYYKRDGLASRETYCLCPVGDTLFFGHDKGKISCYDLRKQEWSELQIKRPVGDGTGSAPVKTLIWDFLARDRVLWIATSDAGLWQYHLDSLTWKFHMPTTGYPAKGGYSLLALEGEILCGTFKGIARYNPDHEVWIMHAKSLEKDDNIGITCLAMDRGYIWYGTRGHGMGRFFWDEIQWVDYSGGLTCDYIRDIHVQGDSLWLCFGYLGGGADLLTAGDFTWKANFSSHYGLCLPRISRIQGDSLYIYFCTFDGLSFMDPDAGSMSCVNREKGLSGNEVLGVHRYKDTVWVAEYTGIVKIADMEQGALPVKELSGMSIAFFQGSNEVLAAGDFRGGVTVYNVDKGRKKSVQLASTQSRITGLCINSPWIWAAYQSGEIWGFHMDSMEKTCINMHKTPAKKIRKLMKENSVTCLAMLENRLWVGTEKCGILVHDPREKTWHHLGFEQGLINDHVLCIREKGDFIWIGHQGGITRIDKSVAKKVVFRGAMA